MILIIVINILNFHVKVIKYLKINRVKKKKLKGFDRENKK